MITDDQAKSAVVTLLKYIGEDVNREGLLETPERFVKAWKHWCSGYDKEPKDVLKVFEDGGSNYDNMVVVSGIPVFSKCEHHLADIIGTATVAYIPNGKIVGLSKLSRLVDMFSRRLQVQERLTTQIAESLFNNLNARGVGVCIKARHMCMESRGVSNVGSHTTTIKLLGEILTDNQLRTEFINYTNKEK